MHLIPIVELTNQNLHLPENKGTQLYKISITMKSMILILSERTIPLLAIHVKKFPLGNHCPRIEREAIYKCSTLFSKTKVTIS